MILIGDKLIPYTDICSISTVEDIKNTKANSFISFGYNEKLLTYCFENDLDYVVIVTSIKEAIYANSLNARYIVCEKILAKSIQKIADNYMFDSKVLALIESSDEIEEIALNEIDGIIYKNVLN
ncbi:hypothetical protein [Poseidonibacter ostreae]|jgi:hypothetical protein|uniref:Uncharacterized protein n=1 Tax=Poseidonibacter ostreae TaxID=2654171 RepID=A0A6L4WS44_9BACT|nr:hypothetical protein [Poseidonibacter ostreae]KAB7887131.1 hypothetical protein GA417_03645 [Poseidonibacter ostreae]KAB7888637.1 hypothetical protein GBG19_08485 [Poseidonibacter ostreae]KAB7892316.1 hypothetical protein GBG18_03435 [Poseidonibacter ostreae]